MDLTVHHTLVKTTDSGVGKQSVERIGDYTVLTTSLNFMTFKQAVLKRCIDIDVGICGCIATGIIFVFIAPIIYINSPGPIFSSQDRVEKWKDI